MKRAEERSDELEFCGGEVDFLAVPHLVDVAETVNFVVEIIAEDVEIDRAASRQVDVDGGVVLTRSVDVGKEGGGVLVLAALEIAGPVRTVSIVSENKTIFICLSPIGPTDGREGVPFGLAAIEQGVVEISFRADRLISAALELILRRAENSKHRPVRVNEVGTKHVIVGVEARKSGSK